MIPDWEEHTVSMPSTDELRQWLRAKLADLLRSDPGEIRDSDRFARLGLDSLRATALAAALSDKVGSRVSPALLWAYPSIT